MAGLMGSSPLMPAEGAPWSHWVQYRNSLPANHPNQDWAGMQEHAAYAREYPELSQLFLIPGYTAAKATGLAPGRSAPSLAEIGAGYHGLAQGLSNYYGPQIEAAFQSFTPMAIYNSLMGR